MADVTLVYPYFENGPMLDVQFSEWARYEHKDRFKIVLVDDCSQRDPAIDHIQNVGIDLELYRIHTDIPWNQDGARNLAMTNSEGWCIMCDMDHVLTAGGSAMFLSKVDHLSPNKYYGFNRHRTNGDPIEKSPMNIMAVHNDLFWRVGGYDERFCGYYGSDVNFISRLDCAVGPRIIMKRISLRMYRAEELPGATTTDYGRKGSEYHVANYPDLRKLLKANKRPIEPLNFEYERLI